jgi:beta-glucosidase
VLISARRFIFFFLFLCGRKQMNLRSYRYSIAWPRIQPSGEGTVNQQGIDYYKRLTDSVLGAGMRPLVTLYHWHLPQALEDKGGWPNRDTAARFADYTEIVLKALGDRIQTWAIFNEPWVFTYLGYGSGVHAPVKKDFDLFLKASHTVNFGQGDSFRAIKAIAPQSKAGTAFSMSATPLTSSPEDAAAAKRFDAALSRIPGSGIRSLPPQTRSMPFMPQDSQSKRGAGFSTLGSRQGPPPPWLGKA